MLDGGALSGSIPFGREKTIHLLETSGHVLKTPIK